MAKKYFDKLNELFNSIDSELIKGARFEIKHFFSGAAVYVNDKICITLTPVGFAIKLPEKKREELFKEKEAKQLRYFPKGHVKKEYVVLPEEMLDDKKKLVRLIKKSFEYVDSNF